MVRIWKTDICLRSCKYRARCSSNSSSKVLLKSRDIQTEKGTKVPNTNDNVSMDQNDGVFGQNDFLDAH